MKALSQLSPIEFAALTRTDLMTFVQRSFAELNGQAVLQLNWHLDVMSAKLQQVTEGKIKCLIINIPPRHLKSLFASVALLTFILGRDPTATIICATYGQDLSDKFARDSRAIMQSGWYEKTFPTRLTQARASLQELVTTKRGFRLSTSVGGVLTGRGGDVIIIDDPIKPIDALSDIRRSSANEWFNGTLYSRLNSKTLGSIVLIMQRLDEDDLTGHLVKNKGWDLISFPAIAETDETHHIDTLFGPKTFIRKTGEALHAERENLHALETIHATLGTYNFASQYQQTPGPSGGGLVKET